MDECKTLPSAQHVPWANQAAAIRPLIRGLHSFNSQLNLSAVYGMEGA